MRAMKIRVLEDTKKTRRRIWQDAEGDIWYYEMREKCWYVLQVYCGEILNLPCSQDLFEYPEEVALCGPFKSIRKIHAPHK